VSWPPARAARPRLTIDLAAIAWNWRRLALLAAPAEVGAVVKADAYGLGLAAAAPALWQAGARSFFVARVEEGVQLRALLPDARIIVLDGLWLGGAADLAAKGLVPALNHPAELALWRETAALLGRKLPAVLQVDTGMHRLGFDLAAALALEPADLAGLDLMLVMSHLACADEPDHPLNEAQRLAFERVRARFPHIQASLASSSGIFLGEGFRHQLCRPGVALWGANPTPRHPNPMRPVVTLGAPILLVREVDAPGTVGYGATWPARAGARLATVPLGYADGILRAAGARGTAQVEGFEVPIAGRISMDLLTLDVTALPPGRVRAGTAARLIWGADGLDRLAAAAGTIAYEVLTRLGGRLERAYLPADTGA